MFAFFRSTNVTPMAFQLARQQEQELDDVVQDKMEGKAPIQAELKDQMSTQMGWWCASLTRWPPTWRIKGSMMPNGMTRLKATLGTMLEVMLEVMLGAMLCRTLEPNLQFRLNSKHQLAHKWPGGASWTRQPPTLRLNGSMPNGTMVLDVLEATHSAQCPRPCLARCSRQHLAWCSSWWQGKDGTKVGDCSKDEKKRFFSSWW
jgi:hypothetical protein